MKRILALILGILMLVSSAAFAEEALILQRPADYTEALAWAKEQTWDKTWKIGYGSLSDTDPIAKVLGDRLVEYCGYYGIEVVRMDNNLDGTTAVRNADLMLNQDIDLLVEFNVDVSVSGAIMQKANDAGVPVVAIDIPHEGATFFGADNYYCGEVAGEFVANAAQEKWGKLDALLLIDQMASGELPRQRVLNAITGVRKVYPDFPDEKVYVIEGGTTVDGAMAPTAAFLSAHPDEKIGVVGLSASQPLAVMSAAEIANRLDDILVVTNNEDVFFSHSQGGDSPWIGCVTFNLINYGKWIAPLAREILDTGVQPENMYVDHKIVTRENMDELFPVWREDMAAGLYPN